jgi:integrase
MPLGYPWFTPEGFAIMAKVLTAAAALRFRPRPQRYEVPDGGCPALYLVVQPSGRKSWAMRFRRPSGKSAKITLGVLDLTGKESEDEPAIGALLTLAAARRLVTGLHHQRAQGKDVAAVRHRQRLERQIRGAATFAQATKDFIEQYAMRKQRRWQQSARLLGWMPDPDGLALIPKGISDRWRDRSPTEITGDDIHFLIDEIREHGIPGLSNRNPGESEPRARMVFAVISTLFAWLVEKRRLVANPCVGLSRPEAGPARDRILSDAEILALWKATESARVPFGQIIRLLLISGCRLREVADARRSEFTPDFAVWTIPPERTKNRRKHIIELPLLARKILASVPIGESELIFSWGNGKRISGFGAEKKQLDRAAGIQAWKIHDLRRAAATKWADDLHISPHVIEVLLNHASAKTTVAATYNQSTYSDQRRVALQRWADHIEGLVSGKPSKVIPLRA